MSAERKQYGDWRDGISIFAFIYAVFIEQRLLWVLLSIAVGYLLGELMLGD